MLTKRNEIPEEIRVAIKGEGFTRVCGGFETIWVGDEPFHRDAVQDRLPGYDRMYEALSKPQTIDNILHGFDSHQLEKVRRFIQSFDGGYVGVKQVTSEGYPVEHDTNARSGFQRT